jgi:hypothetical protein
MNTEKTNAMKQFINGYIECALWASSDTLPDGEVLEGLENETLAPEALAQLSGFAEDWARENVDLLAMAICRHGFNDTYRDADGVQRFREEYSWGQAGHDLWLTQAHHGAGFWDRKLPGDLGEKLTDAAQKYREYTLYVGDDGLVYVN